MKPENIGNNPSKQLEYIRNIKSYSKLCDMSNTIQLFIERYNLQKEDLNKFKETIEKKQIMYNNIASLKNRLCEIHDLITGNNDYFNVIQNLIQENNIESYLKTFLKINESIEMLNNFNIPEANSAKKKLIELKNVGINNILSFYESILNKIIEPFDLSNFGFENDEFLILNEELRNNIFYPIKEETLILLKNITDVLIKFENTQCVQTYVSSRSKFLDTTLNNYEKIPKRNIKSSFDILEIPSYEKHSNQIHILIYIIFFMEKREREISIRIFGNDYYYPAFKKSFGPSFKFLINKIQDLQDSDIVSHLDILFDLDLINSIHDIITNEIFYKKDKSLKTLIDTMRASEIIIKKTLQTYLIAIEKHDFSNVTDDGNVSPLTSNVLIYLSELSNYINPLKTIPGFWFDTLCSLIINNLVKNISEKSNHYQDCVLQQIFLINNYQYISDYFSRDEISSFISSDLSSDIFNLIKKSEDDYIKLTWDTALSQLEDKEDLGPIEVDENKYIILKKKQRMIIKKKFRDFSNKIDEIIYKHNDYAVHNSKYMCLIYEDVIRRIKTNYSKFCKKWENSNFSKTPEKWMSYSPSTLCQKIKNLYS